MKTKKGAVAVYTILDAVENGAEKDVAEVVILIHSLTHSLYVRSSIELVA